VPGINLSKEARPYRTKTNKHKTSKGEQYEQ